MFSIAAAALFAVPLLQSRLQHQQQLRHVRELHELELEHSKRRHQETMESALARYKEGYRAETDQYIRSMAVSVHISRRETMRDVWQQRNLVNQNLVTCTGLMFSCAFEALTQGIIPDGTASWLLYCYSATLSGALLSLLIAIWANYKLQARMSFYDAGNPNVVYRCGKTHPHFNSYFDCHCRLWQRVAIFLFYVGTALVLLAAVSLQTAKNLFLWNDDASAYLFVIIVVVGIVSVLIGNRLVDSKTHDSADDYGGLSFAYAEEDKALAHARRFEKGKGDTQQGEGEPSPQSPLLGTDAESSKPIDLHAPLNFNAQELAIESMSGKETNNGAEAAEPSPKHYMRNWIAFWFMGMINNFYYCLVLDAADHIAESFHLKTYIALVPWANIFFGLFAKLLNAFVFLRTSYNKRATVTAGIALIGLIIVATSPYYGDNDPFRFFLALLGITFIGISSGYGESMVLGYLERFPAKLVGAWSAGTGMSGVLAALLYLLFRNAFSFSDTATFFIMLPWLLVYVAMYFFVIKIPVKKPQTSLPVIGSVGCLQGEADEEPELPEPLVQSSSAILNSRIRSSRGVSPLSSSSPIDDDSRQRVGLLSGASPSSPSPASPKPRATTPLVTAPLREEDVEYSSNWKATSWAATPATASRQQGRRFGNRDDSTELHESDVSLGKRVYWILRLTLFNDVNLLLVYVFEYATQFMAPFAFPCVAQKHSNLFILKNAYVLSQFAYQVGVLCSRSSLACIRVRRVWILSILQGINAVAWLVQAKVQYLSYSYDGPLDAYSGSHAESEELWRAIILLIWMYYVGLLGGASYVNVFYNILNLPELTLPATEADVADGSFAEVRLASDVQESPAFPYRGVKRTKKGIKADRELAMNVGSLFAVIGITTGSLVDLIFSNTFLSGGSCSG